MKEHRHAIVPDGEIDAELNLQLQPIPTDARHVLGAGIYEVVLALTANDTDAQYYKVLITFDGKWWAGEAAKEHLTLTIVGGQRLARSLSMHFAPITQHRGIG